MYFIAGYVARKLILPTGCKACMDVCLVSKDKVPKDVPAEACKGWDMGGLSVVPIISSRYSLIQTLEDRLSMLM